MKTPIQQLLAELNEKHPSFLTVDTKEGRERIVELEKYLEIEQKAFYAIGSACYHNGLQDGYRDQVFNSSRVNEVIDKYKDEN